MVALQPPEQVALLLLASEQLEHFIALVSILAG
jgi:hypothetical protein